MQEDSEDKSAGLRRELDEEVLEESALGQPRQGWETLKPGYSWIAHLQNEHPDYELVSYDGIPWTEFGKAHYEATVALVTTAGVYVRGQKPFAVSSEQLSPELVRQKFSGRGDPSFRVIPNSADVRDLWLARPLLEAGGIEDDINVVFPLERLRELEEESFISAAAAEHLSFMGYLPYPEDLEKSSQQVIQHLKKSNANLVVLTPGDALSHQSMAVIQRAIEAAGISTISIALCRDVVEHVGVPRSVHYRFPFGSTLGDANDQLIQLHILKDTIRSVETITEPGTVVELPYEWGEG